MQWLQVFTVEILLSLNINPFTDKGKSRGEDVEGGGGNITNTAVMSIVFLLLLEPKTIHDLHLRPLCHYIHCIYPQ